jgi:hypothetical protein
MGVLGVTDEDFFTDPFRDREGALDRLDARDEIGVVLDAPTTVRIDLRDDVPLAGARRELLSSSVGAGFRQRAALVALRVDSNEVWAASLFAQKDPAPESEDPPEEPDDPTQRTAAIEPFLDGVMTDFFAASLRDRVPSLPWRAGLVRVTVLLDDDRSNTVEVALDDGGDGDPAVAEFVARHRTVGYPRAVSPKPSPRAPLPSFLPVAGSPAPPAIRGIALELPARVSLSVEPACVLRASFRLPCLAREVVRPRDARDDRFATLTGAGWTDVGDRDATAVIALTLVVTLDDGDPPSVMRLDVPVYEPASVGASVRGFVALDLFEHPEMPRQPGRYRLWALSGDVLVGPRLVELVP